MELLVATWSLRFALTAAVAVAWLTVNAGGSPVDAVDRAALAAFVFTFLGRQLIGWLEPPEQRMLRLRARRSGAGKKGTASPHARAATKESATGGSTANPAATTSSTSRSRAA